MLDDLYRNPGPPQFEGAGADDKTFTLSIKDQDYMGRIKKLQDYLDTVGAFSIVTATLSGLVQIGIDFITFACR